MLRGRFQDRRPLDFDEDYFVDVHQLNRKTQSNIGYKTLLKIFTSDPKCRFTVLAIKHPSAAENNQEWVVIKVRASQGHAASVNADGDISRNQYTLAKAIFGNHLPEDARKAGLTLSLMKDAPGKLCHRTSKAAADSIVRTGVVPGCPRWRWSNGERACAEPCLYSPRQELRLQCWGSRHHAYRAGGRFQKRG